MKIEERFWKSLWFQLLLFSVVSVLVYNTFTHTQEPHWMPDVNLRAVVEKTLREEIGLPEDIPLQKEHMEFLVNIIAENRGIRSLQGLEFAINLEELDVYRNQIEDIHPLSNLPKLNRLVIWHNQVSDISPLASIETLTDLNISDNPISDLHPLSELIGLRVIKAWTCQIRDVASLSELIYLKELHLRGNSIGDVSPLANLTQLEVLDIRDNPIVDFSALQHLNLTEYAYNPICDQTFDFPAPSIQERVTTRTYPSIFQAGNPVIGIDGLTSADFYNNPTKLLTKDEYIVIHDLHFSDFSPYLHAFVDYRVTKDQPYPGLSTLIGVEDIELAKASHQHRLGLNPNYVFLSGDGFYVSELGDFPIGSNFLLRGDITGNLIMYGGHNPYLNLLNPEVQELIITKTVNFATCGLFDGIFIDSFTSFTNEKNGRIDRTQMSVEMGAKIMDALVHIFQEIRKRVPDNFLILVNAGGAGKPSRFTEYINGSFMESTREPDRHYNHSDLIELEDTLLWNEKNYRYPQINCLEGFGLPNELPDGPNNQRWMRVFTTLSLTHSDGYVLYNTGGAYIGEPDHEHIWYDFWDADLGHPVGDNETKGQLYDNREGVFIREFTNGWAVYNRSGKAQEVSLPIQTTGVASGITSFKHTVPDLDGEMFLKTDVSVDVNGDGVVNILDLVAVANAFGNAEPDLNGDGVVNILDLVIVANAFSG